MPNNDSPTADLTAGIATSVQAGPDGQPWGVLHIQTPLLQSSWFLPPTAIETLSIQLPGFLEELLEKVQEARKKTTNGLVVSGSMDDAKMIDSVNRRLKGTS